LFAALEPYRVAPWPFAPHAAAIRESDDTCTEVHVIRDWRWLGTARDEGELAQILEAPASSTLDIDVTRLLLRTFARTPSAFAVVVR
jgi:hypothetical protein